MGGGVVTAAPPTGPAGAPEEPAGDAGDTREVGCGDGVVEGGSRMGATGAEAF